MFSLDFTLNRYCLLRCLWSRCLIAYNGLTTAMSNQCFSEGRSGQWLVSVISRPCLFSLHILVVHSVQSTYYKWNRFCGNSFHCTGSPQRGTPSSHRQHTWCPLQSLASFKVRMSAQNIYTRSATGENNKHCFLNLCINRFIFILMYYFTYIKVYNNDPQQ